ncbi:MAG: hypothetical protein FJ137_20685 [Deltaproteobacteria bacterium]|nr:hypothetical protein [Deltaproteobacteria bacterium]
MKALIRLLESPFELAAFGVIGATAIALAVTRASAASGAEDRNEALGVLQAVIRAQADARATKGRFATSLQDFRSQLTFADAKVVSPRVARSERYTYYLWPSETGEAWRLTAVGSLDEDPWPDVLVAQGMDINVTKPVVTVDDLSHRVVRAAVARAPR